jgi:ECF transporter S component (folate family)
MNHSRNSVRKLTMLALLTAMSIVFARVLSISTGFVRFNLGSLPTLLAAVLFGPVEGFADMIGGTLSGYAINPLITLGAGSIGLTAGLLWRALPNLRLGLRTQISVFAGHAVGSIVINSLALHLFYNYPWSVLVTRIPNALVLAAVNTVLVRLLLENKTIRGIAQ